MGKTSFLNVQQYRLAAEIAPFGPKVLPAYFLTPVNPCDSPRAVAERLIQNLVKSVETYCDVHKSSVPSQVKKIRKWMSSPGASGFDFGLQILGVGGNLARTVDIPSISDATFETLQDVISALVSESTQKLNVNSVILVLDNIENLTDDELKTLLITFRDTLFNIPLAWWVLIGQAGLSSLVRELDPRVADRIEGEGIELQPISLNELHEAVRLRIQRFSNNGEAKPPVPQTIHKALYEYSRNEIRFVFKYANSICIRYVEDMRNRVLALLQTAKSPLKITRNDVAKRLMERIIESPLSDLVADQWLKQLCKDEIARSSLTPKEISVLQKIGQNGSARGKDHAAFGVKSNQQFSSLLVPLRKRQFLASQQQGTGVIYTLRGLAAVSYTYGLLDSK